MRLAPVPAIAFALLSQPALVGAQPPPPPLPDAYAPPAGAPAPGPAPVVPPVSPLVPSKDARPPWELALSLGFGNAVCDNKEPTSDCPVDGGLALSLGADYRFHPHWAAGLEVAAWAFNVRDEWQGQLADKATKVEFTAAYFSPIARWYWFDSGPVDPYLQAGVGLGSVTSTAKNDASEYVYTASGVAYSLGIGAEWQLSSVFRLGPQFLAYLHVSSKICEKATGVDERCRAPSRNEKGEREGLALPWRLVAVGTFTLGDR